VPARRPRSSPAATRWMPTSPPRASSRRRRRPPTLRAFGAPAGCIRAGPHPPPYLGSRRFRTSGRVFLPPLGRDGRTAYPSVAPVGETHPEAQRPWRCRSRPLLQPAIRRNLARASAHHMTTSRGPRDEALHDRATPTGAPGGLPEPLWGRRPACRPDGWAANPNSEFRILDLVGVRIWVHLGDLWAPLSDDGKSEIRNPKFLSRPSRRDPPQQRYAD